MKNLFNVLAAALAYALALTPATAAQESAAGHAVLRITDETRNRPVHMDIWYPTTSQQEQPQNYGFGMGRVARNAKVAGDRLPVVLFSHGAFGAASNYSWLTEHLARQGYVVLGVSHFAESPVFGRESIDSTAAGRFGDRTRDLNFALSFLLQKSPYAAQLDATRVAVMGHSSGGASMLMLAGAQFAAGDLAAYCGSVTGGQDKGCLYASAAAADGKPQQAVPSTHRLRALVVMDPAVGPALTAPGLRGIQVPTLVIGAVQNDFLPFDAHAQRISALIPGAILHRLDHGEGHFVFVDECSLPIDAQGVKLCSDRQGVDRAATHKALQVTISDFLRQQLR